MKFQDNHILHFIVVILLIIGIGSGVYYKQVQIEKDTVNTNRIASAKLILNALEVYKKSYGAYPQKLNDIKEFLQPIPIDILTKKPFEYSVENENYTLHIPQEGRESFTVKGLEKKSKEGKK